MRVTGRAAYCCNDINVDKDRRFRSCVRNWIYYENIIKNIIKARKSFSEENELFPRFH